LAWVLVPPIVKSQATSPEGPVLSSNDPVIVFVPKPGRLERNVLEVQMVFGAGDGRAAKHSDS
jgi:hypothetical protein